MPTTLARTDMTALSLTILSTATVVEKVGSNKNIKFSPRSTFTFSQYSESNEVIDKTISNADNIVKIGKVFDVKQSVLSGVGRASDQILEYFNALGNVVVRKGMKKIEVVKAGAKSTTFHGFGEDKLLAAGAIKDVIESGTIIDFQENWKNRGYNTYVISGYGKLKNTDSIVSVVIREYPSQPNLNNKFDLHEVIIIEGESHIVTASESRKTVSDLPSDKNGTSSSPARQEENAENSKKSLREDTSASREALVKENELLKKDVGNLREMLRLQGKATGGKLITRHSSDIVANRIMKQFWFNDTSTYTKQDVRDIFFEMYSMIQKADLQ